MVERKESRRRSRGVMGRSPSVTLAGLLLTFLFSGQVGTCLSVGGQNKAGVQESHTRFYSPLTQTNNRVGYGRSSSSSSYPASSSSSSSSNPYSSSYPYSSSSSSSSSSSRGRYDEGGGRKGVEKPTNNNHYLELHGVEVPVFKFRGEDARLECKFERNSDPLYSVKWYKDDLEFYRYLSKNKNPKQTFPTPGVHVDLQYSNAQKVQLKNLTFNSTGMYKCEVSGDSPYFRTYEQQKLMMVVELPERGPTIEGGKTHYRVGETARLNCTASKSKPAAHLSWFINKLKVLPPHLVEYYPWVHRDGLESRRLGLVFTVNQTHFQQGGLELRCQATVATFYTFTKEEDATIYSEKPVILQTKSNFIHVRNAVCTVLPTFVVTAVVVMLAAVVGARDVT